MAQASKNNQFKTDLPEDMTDRVYGLMEAHDLSQAEVSRRLMKKGLYADSRAQRYADDARDIGKLLIGLGIGAFAVGLFIPGVRTVGVLVLMLVFCAFGMGGLLLSDYLEPEGL